MRVKLAETSQDVGARPGRRASSGAPPPSYVGSTLSPLSVLPTLPSGSGVRDSLTAPQPADPEQQEGARS